VLLGAAENPFARPFEWRATRLAKKVAAGAQFVQTQFCYDLPLLRNFMDQVEALGLLDKVFILVGVGPLRTAKAAEWIRTHVPGVHIPDAVIERLRGAADQTLEGRKICTELIQEIRAIKGVHGVHVMAYRQEEAVAEIIARSGVLAGRVPWHPERDLQTNPDRKVS
jgi:methylenetetrahydrofolate reductase (NADPH)